jgi:hypothetical protein
MHPLHDALNNPANIGVSSRQRHLDRQPAGDNRSMPDVHAAQ